VSKFETKFATSQPHYLTSIALVGIRQEKGEPLRKFIDRFGKVAMSIRNLSLKVVMHHMLTTLRPRSFADNLCMQPTANLDELRRRAAKFMQLEELREFYNQARAEASGEKEKEEKEHQCRSVSDRGDKCIDNQGELVDKVYPLTTDKGRILDKVLSAKLIPPPRKAASPDNVDQLHRYRHHQNNEHTIEECQTQDKIEEVIQVEHHKRSELQSCPTKEILNFLIFFIVKMK